MPDVQYRTCEMFYTSLILLVQCINGKHVQNNIDMLSYSIY